MKSVYTAL